MMFTMQTAFKCVPFFLISPECFANMFRMFYDDFVWCIRATVTLQRFNLLEHFFTVGSCSVGACVTCVCFRKQQDKIQFSYNSLK